MGSVCLFFFTLLIGPPCIEAVSFIQVVFFLERKFNRFPCECLKPIDTISPHVWNIEDSASFRGHICLCPTTPDIKNTETEKVWLDPPKLYQANTKLYTNQWQTISNQLQPGCLREVIFSSQTASADSGCNPQDVSPWGIGCAVNFGWLRWPDRTGPSTVQGGPEIQDERIRKDVSLRIRWYVLRIRD